MYKMSSAFIVYWNRLKEENPEVYQQKLKRNRDRIQKRRAAIYADKELHETYKQKQREKYAASKQD
jgi:hypothetical protein